MSNDIQQQIEEAKSRIEALRGNNNAEIQEPVSETNETTVSVNEEVDPFLDEAVKMGYNPNYEGPNKKSPEQFVKDGSFFRKIDSLNKKIEHMSTVIKEYDEHNKRVEKSAYEKGLHDALQRRRDAVEIGDVYAFNKADLEVQELQQNAAKFVPAQPEVPKPSEDMVQWAKDNESWFNQNNPRLVTEADGLFTLEKQYNPHMSDKELLSRVKENIQKLHPEHFENPMKEKAPVVVKTKVTTKTTTDLISKLTPRQKDFFDSAKARGSKLSIEDYVRQLQMSGGLKDE